jgi:hypothetical protein
MSLVRAVSANGDFPLLSPGQGPSGRFTVSWSALGGATLQLFMRLQEDVSDLQIDAPVANGKFTAASVDGQSTTLQSVNVEVRGEQLLARITGYSAPFTIWCS